MQGERVEIRPCNKAKCSNCIFHPNQTLISEERLNEIRTYLAKGTSHQCHKTNHVCYGGREFQA